MNRQLLKEKMKKITDNQLFIQIYQILKTDSSFKPSVNNNGIYFNLVPLDESTVETISDIINESFQTETVNKLSYASYYNESENDKLKKQLIKLNLF